MEERDASVVARARDGDRDAFHALVERHSRYIFSMAHRMTGNAQDAEDVVQDAWLKAHKQLSRFEARADFRTWLHRITVNCSIDLIRARRHREDEIGRASCRERVGVWVVVAALKEKVKTAQKEQAEREVVKV